MKSVDSLAAIASCFDSWLACACSTLLGWILNGCSLYSIVVLLVEDRSTLLHVQVGHVVEVGHLQVSWPGQEFPQSIVEKLTAPASIHGMIWGRDYFYAVPRLQGSRPNWGFAQIRPVTRRLWRSSHPSPQAQLRTNA